MEASLKNTETPSHTQQTSSAQAAANITSQSPKCQHRFPSKLSSTGYPSLPDLDTRTIILAIEFCSGLNSNLFLVPYVDPLRNLFSVWTRALLFTVSVRHGSILSYLLVASVALVCEELAP